MFKSRDKEKTENLHAKILKIQTGDQALREEFIAEFKGFIIKVASKTCKRYIDTSNCDEYSISLIAFNEAIDTFSAQKGWNFLDFATVVIKRKLANFYKKEQTAIKTVTLIEELTEEGSDEQGVINYDIYPRDSYDKQEMRLEISDFSKKLIIFGIQLKDLVFDSPVHNDSLKLYIKIANEVASDPVLYGKLLRKKILPSGEVAQRLNISRRTVERNRKFIVAVVIVLTNDWPMIKSFIEVEHER